MHLSAAATEAVRDAVRACMALETGGAPSWCLPAGIAGDDFLAAVRRQRVVEVVAVHAQALGMPAPMITTLLRERDAARLQCMVQARELALLSQLLTRTGLPFLAFKGPALAVQTTGDFTARGFGDLDLFVDPTRVSEVHGVLEEAGWEHDSPFPRPGPSWAWRHLLNTYYEMPFTGPRSRIDLHWRLDPTQGALPAFDVAWRRRTPVIIGHVEVATLALPDAFQHTCSHAGKDDWRWLRSLVDVHRLSRRQEVWPAAAVRRVDLMTLAATEAAIGLPDQVPAAVRARLRTQSAAVRIARQAQGRPFLRAGQQAPGIGLPSAIRRQLRGSRAPADVARLLYGVVLPANHGPATDASPITAVPTAAVERATSSIRKVRNWRRANREAPNAEQAN